MLIELIKTSSLPVQTVVQGYMDSVVYSLLKTEYEAMSPKQKRALITKLSKERK